MTKENLLEVLATISRSDLGQIQTSTPLSSLLAGSLGRARLDAALRTKYSMKVPRVYQANTFGELCELLEIDGVATEVGENVSVPTTETKDLPHVSDAYDLGIDIENVADLPEVYDYWDDSFYQKTFTPSEIAYALLQPTPRQSFAAMWCAKEAVRKAVPSLAQSDWTRIEVAHGPDGRPAVHVDGHLRSGTLSLSHTGTLAVAVYLDSPVPKGNLIAKPPVSSVPVFPSVPAVPARNISGAALWAAFPAILALAISLVALMVSILLHR